MPRSLRAAALLLLALLPLLAMPTRAAVPAAVAQVGPGDIYLALGDSLPAGFEVTDDGQPGYPAQLLTELRKLRPAIVLENRGQATGTGVSGGETSTTFRAAGGQLEQAVAFLQAQRAAGKVVSPVTLSIGGNDAIGVLLPGSSTTLTDALTLYRANLEVILDTLVAAMTEGGVRTGDLLIQNYYNAYPGLADDPRYKFILTVNPDADLPKFNQIIVEEAAERAIPVADVYTRFLGSEAAYTFVKRPYADPSLFLSDPSAFAADFDFHPRPFGHRAISAAFIEAGGYSPRVYVPLLAR